VVQDVLVRVTVGVEAHTHEYISTAHEDQKFGFSIAGGDAMEALARVFETDNLRLVGLHSHIGSQIFELDGFEIAARRMLGLLREAIDKFGIERTAQISTLDLGGGLGISYLPSDNPPPLDEFAANLRGLVAAQPYARIERVPARMTARMIEMAYIAGNSGARVIIHGSEYDTGFTEHRDLFDCVQHWIAVDGSSASFEDLLGRGTPLERPVDAELRFPDPLSASLDHVLPLARGGRHTRENVRLTHLRCNVRRGATTLLAQSEARS